MRPICVLFLAVVVRLHAQVEMEIEFEGPGGLPEMTESWIPGQIHEDAHMPGPIMPFDDFKDLFAGALMMSEGGNLCARPDGLLMPCDGRGPPDPMIMDLLEGMNPGFRQQVLPTIHKSDTRKPLVHQVCKPELERHCPNVPAFLHCLGHNQAAISPECRGRVQRAVPFACHGEISRWCTGPNRGSLLNCLNLHQMELSRECRAATESTRQVLDKTNTHKAAVHEARGARSVSAMQQASGFPSQPNVALPSATQLGFSAAVKERDLDAKLRGGGGLVPGQREQNQAAASQEKMLDAKLGLGGMPGHPGREKELDAKFAMGFSPPVLSGLRRPMTLPFPSGGLDFSQQGHMGSHSATHVPRQAEWSWSQLCVVLVLAGAAFYVVAKTDLLARLRLEITKRIGGEGFTPLDGSAGRKPR
jgi:hypothetical protein